MMSVNCETARMAPYVSSSDRFSLPSSSSKMRSRNLDGEVVGIGVGIAGRHANLAQQTRANLAHNLTMVSFK